MKNLFLFIWSCTCERQYLVYPMSWGRLGILIYKGGPQDGACRAPRSVASGGGVLTQGVDTHELGHEHAPKREGRIAQSERSDPLQYSKRPQTPNSSQIYHEHYSFRAPIRGLEIAENCPQIFGPLCRTCCFSILGHTLTSSGFP